MNNNNLFNKVYNPDVLTCLANLSSDEVFTPPEVVNRIIDMLPQELFENPDTTFLDPACKSGVFLREIAKRLNKGLEKQIPDLQERLNHIFHKQLFAIAITELTSLLSRRSVYCTKYPQTEWSVSRFKSSEGNIRFKNIKHSFKSGKCFYCGASEEELGMNKRDKMESHAYEFIHNMNIKEIYNMKFDVIISNPPYQLNDGGGNGSSAMPIYQHFVDKAKKLNPRFIAMIIPSRWFSGGKGLDKFRLEMLNDDRIREIHDYGNSSDCFPGVSIEGGVCYFLWNRDNTGLCKVSTHAGDKITTTSIRPLLEKNSDVFIRYNEMISIIRKVQDLNEPSFSSIVSPRNPYYFDSDFEKNLKGITDAIKVLGVENLKRAFKNFPLSSIKRNINELNSYRLFISKADGAAGQIGFPIPARIIGKTEIGKPGTACTETFLRVGPFRNEKETMNAQKYMQTKFFRALVGARKNKNMTQDTYSFAPLQDFSIEWDDNKLYKKYELDSNEIEFIENMIQSMED